MLTTPWLLERYGYRHTYSGAVLLLMAGGIVGGLSQWFELVLAMRVAEGLAAGVLQPIPAIIILHAFGAGEQGKAMGIFGFGVVLAPALGPSVGGVLVEWFGWRSIFFVVVPFCVVALCAGAALPAGRRARRRADQPARRAGSTSSASAWSRSRCSRCSTAWSTCTAATLDLGLALLACSAIATVGFVVHQRRGARPLMALAPVRAPRLRDGRHASRSSTAWRCSARPTWCRCSCRSRCTCRRRRPARCCCRPGSCSR